MVDRLRHAKVNHLGDDLLVVFGHQDVRRLDVAVNDPFLVSMLNCLAYRNQQLQSLSWRELVFVTILRNGLTLDQFHDEIRMPGIGCPGIKRFGNVRVIHERQGLTLRLKPSHDVTRVHAGLNDLQCHAPPYGLELLGHVHHPHAAFADLLQQFVGADLSTETHRGSPLNRLFFTQAGRWNIQGTP